MEVYIDDMVVKSMKAEDHLRDLKDAFGILNEYNMKLNPLKCHFRIKSGKFLGYMVTKIGIEASPEQVKAIIELKSPYSTKDIQRPTGRVTTLNKFISRYSERCKPFYDILKKNNRFEWTEYHKKGFQELKNYLSFTPLLVKPIDGEPLLLYLSVSSNVVSVVLAKDLNGDQHRIYYVKMSGRMEKWSVKLSTFDIRYEPRSVIKSQALTDFVAEFSDDLQNEVDMEGKQLLKHEHLGKWTLFTDGASNKKGTGLGIILKSPQGDILPQAVNCEFNTTNNEAEYEALIMRIQLDKDLQIRDLHVFVDCLLLTNHFNGSYVVKGLDLSLVIIGHTLLLPSFSQPQYRILVGGSRLSSQFGQCLAPTIHVPRTCIFKILCETDQRSLPPSRASAPPPS
ncbi:uncharacterized protein LOC111894186 [Lactuca sativa]|uniref:uncharacterized protein LOC111894186 n=1 Tax=Lactuca sativa TaxID=4236 RepID=UPI000CD920A9|nr:uncharacterized protein LOC111894186 [Lactuca sativa]